jgi:hypothetical protein
MEKTDRDNLEGAGRVNRIVFLFHDVQNMLHAGPGTPEGFR